MARRKSCLRKVGGTTEDNHPELMSSGEQSRNSCYLLCISVREAQQPDPTAPPQNHSTPHCGWLWAPAHPPRSSPAEGRQELESLRHQPRQLLSTITTIRSRAAAESRLQAHHKFLQGHFLQLLLLQGGK